MILNRLRLNTLPDSIYLSWVCLKAVLDSAQMDSALSGQRSSWTQRCPCAWLNQHLFYIYIFKMMFGPFFFLLKTFNVLMNRLKISHFLYEDVCEHWTFLLIFFSYTVYGHHFMATLRKQSNTSNSLLPGRCKAPRMEIPEEYSKNHWPLA